MTRNPEIMELLRKQQKYLSFLKTPPVENYDEKEVDRIIREGDENNDKLYNLVNDTSLLMILDVDEMTTEEVYDRVMSKDGWILMPGPKHEEVTNE